MPLYDRRVFTLAAIDPTSAEAQAVLREYYNDIVSRYHGRPATPAELERVLTDEPSDDLVGEGGTFVVAIVDDRVSGCCGIRYIDADTAELTRVFVAPTGRGRGLAQALIGEVEQQARKAGRTVARLDVRSDLVEARSLYARLGYAEVSAFNESPYADHWMAKPL